MREHMIKKCVDRCVRMYGTRDPFELADQMGVLYQIGKFSFAGCYMFLKNHRYIFLSDQLCDEERRVVMAHELGHAVLHRKQNCYFIRNKTLFLNSKTEKEANQFAADLLISDDILMEAKEHGYTKRQLARIIGCHEILVDMKYNHMEDVSHDK